MNHRGCGGLRIDRREGRCTYEFTAGTAACTNVCKPKPSSDQAWRWAGHTILALAVGAIGKCELLGEETVFFKNAGKLIMFQWKTTQPRIFGICKLVLKREKTQN